MMAYDNPELDEKVLIEEAKTNPEAFGSLYERYVTKESQMLQDWSWPLLLTLCY